MKHFNRCIYFCPYGVVSINSITRFLPKPKAILKQVHIILLSNLVFNASILNRLRNGNMNSNTEFTEPLQRKQLYFTDSHFT